MERIAFIGMTANMEEVFAHAVLSFLPHSLISNHLNCLSSIQDKSCLQSCYTLGAIHTAKGNKNIQHL